MVRTRRRVPSWKTLRQLRAKAIAIRKRMRSGRSAIRPTLGVQR